MNTRLIIDLMARLHAIRHTVFYDVRNTPLGNPWDLT